MSIRQIKVHKMYEEFHIFPTIIYVGEYDALNNLVNAYNALNQKLTRMIGTYQYQWVLIDRDVYLVEEDPEYQSKTRQ